MMQSIVQKIGHVDFPAFMGERIYMKPFRMETGLPEELKRWQETVDQMLVGVDTDGPIYLMVDQKFVPAQTLHRRGGLHIDGFWIPGTQIHGGGHITQGAHGGGGGHGVGSATVGGHGNGGGGHKATPRSAPATHGTAPRHGMCTNGIHNSHRAVAYDYEWPTEAIILASDIPACRAWIGEWDGNIADDGDVSHIDFSHMEEIHFEANVAYAGNVTFVHQSIPVLQDCWRTVVRLNVPGHVVH